MSQRLKIAFVVTLVVVNVALVFLVREKLLDARAEAERATPTVAPTTSPSSATPSPDPTAAPGGRQSLTVASDDSIFRVHGGSCDGNERPAIRVSTDGGGTFEEVGVPDDVRAVFALTAEDADTMDLVAGAQRCEPQRFVSTDGGDTWEAAEGADVWFLGPRARVTSPAGVVQPGCAETLTLSAPTPDTGRVFCASGVLIGSNDAGETWNRFGELDGVKAAAYATPRRAFALAPDGGCATGSYVSDDGGRAWTAAGCLDAGPARAMATNGDLVAAIAGDAVYVSEDGGRTWARG